MKDYSELHIRILNWVANHSNSSNPISGQKLAKRFDISYRQLKKIIADLREDYPIVARETDGGGYWLAENDDQIINFISMMQKRKQGYEDTIKKMNNYLADYGNIPFID